MNLFLLDHLILSVVRMKLTAQSLNTVFSTKLGDYSLKSYHRCLVSKQFHLCNYSPGLWRDIFKALARMSILVNAFLLAWASDIVNKLLFLIGHCDPEDIVSTPYATTACRR